MAKPIKIWTGSEWVDIAIQAPSTSGLATTSALTAHEADTTNVHGIADTSQLATQTYVNTQVANLVNSAPAALDTLDELAQALGDDASFATTVTTSIAGKVSKSGGDTITVESGTTVPLTIQNNGTGNSFVVNDVASDTGPFVIDADGRVGINNPTPSAALEVNGNANFGSSNGVVSGGHSLNSRSTANWNFAGVNVIRNATNTTTPRLIAMPLDADDLAATTIGTYNAIWGEYSGNPTTGSTSSGLSGQMLLGAHSGFKFVTNGTERLRVASTGRVTLPTGGVLEAPVSTNAQTTSYTLVLTDAGRLVEMNVASANNLTVPLESSVNFPIGTKIDILQTGSGQTTVVATGGVTINASPGLKLSGQWSAASLIKRAANTWVLIGNLSA